MIFFCIFVTLIFSTKVLMIFCLKYTIHFKSKAFLFLLLISFFPFKSLGQGFEWVYSSKGVVSQSYIPSSPVKHLVTNSNNDIYAIGRHDGHSDFGDGQEEIAFFTDILTSGFLVKLDENKNVIWAKNWRVGGSYLFHSIKLDENENIFISGYVLPAASTLYFDPNPPNPVFQNIFSPTHEGISRDQYYGFVLKLDANGNYIDTILFEDTLIYDIELDNNNNIIAVGHTILYSDNIFIAYLVEWGYITKLDNSLTPIWEKKFDNQNSSSFNGFSGIEVDSQNNIYCAGFYRNSFRYGSAVLDQVQSEADSTSKFIFKLLPNLDESWIIDLLDYTVSQMKIDVSDNIFFTVNYTLPSSLEFNNTIIDNLPLSNDLSINSVLFKVDSNRNHIWDIPLFGLGDQRLIDFDFNSLGELIMPIKSEYNQLFYKNVDTTVDVENASALLLKANSSGELIDYKHLFENTIEDRVNVNTISTDTEDNILLGGYFSRETDFDPHPFNDYVLSTDIFEIGDTGWFFYETRAYVLKLTNCDIEPLFEDTYEFCSGTTPNPVIADIKPKALNVKWYSSMVSTTPLSDDFEVIDGQTYFYENIVENCPNFERLPVVMTIFVAPPPTLDALQPCYVENLMLSDLQIIGQNITFYDSIDGDAISSSTLIIPEKTYYISQTIDVCESERIPIVISDVLGASLNQYTLAFCKEDEEDIFEVINLSEYNNFFLPANAVASDFDFSYHNSFDDANGNLNPITNYQNYQVTNQTIFIRIYSEQNSCYKITQLVIQFSTPPTIENIITEDWTDNNNTITVLPNIENYLYSLDGITYQNSNYFENIAAGEYSIYIKNELNCVGIAEKVYLLNYPKFFTPNGDGVNDYWKIKFSEFQELFQVEIFDRYGKFIKSFDKNSIGWDGKYNGIDLPTSDYWFKIIRITDNEIIYRGHFSLKR